MHTISVILPVYNGLPYLKESVESILNQSLHDIEFLILDDCSTDGSWEYLNSLKDDRIRLYRNEKNRGLFYNLNFLIGKSEKSLIKLWSQDDIMMPAALESIVKFHNGNDTIGFSYTSVRYIDESSKLIKELREDTTPAIIDKETHARICFMTGSIAGNIANVTIAKKAIEKVGLFNESMIISGDFDMWVRIAEFYDIGFIKQPLIYLRDHSGQLSRQGKYYIKHIEEDIQVFNKLFSYLPPPLIKEGRSQLRKNKLVFYYTLMLHAFLKGQFKDARSYWKTIGKIDSPVQITFYFIKKKFIPGK